MSKDVLRESSITDADFDRTQARIRRRERKRKTQAAISLSASAWDRIKKASDDSGVSMRKIAEAACTPEKLAELQEHMDRIDASTPPTCPNR